MKDAAKAKGFKGRRNYNSEGNPQHRRKGGGKDQTNSARRTEDKAEVRNVDEVNAARIPVGTGRPGNTFTMSDGTTVTTTLHEFFPKD